LGLFLPSLRDWNLLQRDEPSPEGLGYSQESEESSFEELGYFRKRDRFLI